MKSLKDFFRDKDKKTIMNIVTVLAIGLILLMMGSTLVDFGSSGGAAQTDGDGDYAVSSGAAAGGGLSYEERLGRRLEETLCEAAGVGKVKVMVTLAYGREIVVAEDVFLDENNTKETDVQGGSREIDNSKNQTTKIIMSDTSGKDIPLVLKEIEPKVEGVLIVAEGGDNIFIKDALIKATQAILGLEAHKIQVMKMK